MIANLDANLDGDIPIGSMYAIYGNIYHQYTPNVSIYIPYMDPIGNGADYSKARSVLSVEREDIGSEN